MTTPKRRYRRLFAGAVLVGALVALVLSAARVFLHGENLGAFIAEMLNKRMRGRIQVGAIEWELSSLPTVIRGGWVPVTARNVVLWDDCMQSPEGRQRRSAASVQVFVTDLPCSPDDTRAPGLTPRKKLLETALATAEIDVHALMFGGPNLVFRNLRVHGGEVLLEQSAEPTPLHDYDKTTISLISAFQPRLKPGFRAGIFADKPPPIFDLRDVHLMGIGVTYHHRATFTEDNRAKIPFVLRVENASVDFGDHERNHAFLYADNRDPLLPKLYFSVPIVAGPAKVRILDEGPVETFGLGPIASGPNQPRKARFEIPLSSIQVQRLAQLPRRWSQGDPLASTLELELTARTEAGGELRIWGELRDYKDSAFSGTWALDVVGENLGPTLTSSIHPALSGEHVSARLGLRGPFIAAPRIEIEQVSGLRYSALLPKRPGDPPALRLGLASFTGWLDLVNDQGALRQTVAQVLDETGAPKGGQVRLDATFGLNPFRINHADLDAFEPLDVGPYLPPSAQRLLGRYVRGKLRGEGDTEQGFALRGLDLAMGTGSGDTRARILDGRIFTQGNFSSIEIAKDDPLQMRLGASKMTVSGKYEIGSRWMNLRASGIESPDLGLWLRRAAPGGSTAFCASCTVEQGGFVAVTGNTSAVAIEGKATLGGVPYVGQVALDAHFEDGVVDLRDARVTSLGGTLAAKGQIRVGPVPSARNLLVQGKGLSSERIAALAGAPGLATGKIEDISVRIHGPLSARSRLLDWLDLFEVYLHTEQLTVLRELTLEGVSACVSRGTAPMPAYCGGRDTELASARTDRCDSARAAGGTCAIVNASLANERAEAQAYLTKVPRSGTQGSAKGPFPLSDLDGEVQLSGLPLRILNELAGTGALGGTLDVRGKLGGTSDAWTASGVIELIRGMVLGAFVGDLQIAITPGKNGRPGQSLHFSGTALGGRLIIEGSFGTARPFPVELRIAGRRIELDPVLGAPLVGGFPLRSWITGEARLTTELAPAGKTFAQATELQVELEEAGGIWDARIGDLPAPVQVWLTGSQSRTVRLRATADALESVCRVDDKDAQGRVLGTRYEACPLRLITPAGAIDLSLRVAMSELTPRSLEASATGQLSLQQLPLPLLSALTVLPPLEELSGTLSLTAQVSTPLDLAQALARLKVEVRPLAVRIRPSGQETVVAIPGGLLRLENASVGVTDLRLLVDDIHQQERGELTIRGGIKLAGLAPKSWSVTIDGQVPGRLLMLAPTVFSQASGVVSLDPPITLMGDGPWPRVSGGLVFDDPSEACQERDDCASLAVIARGWPREVAFRSGAVDLTTRAAGRTPVYELAATDVRVVLDGQGQIKVREGSVVLRDLELAQVALTLDVQKLPYQAPSLLDLTLGGQDLELRYDKGKPWLARGRLEIVEGRFIRNFNVGDLGDVLRPATPPGGAARPFYETLPLGLGSANLAFDVTVRRLAVANNIGNIEMNGRMQVLGTPRELRMEGQIAVVRGTFRLPGSRAEFTNTSGTIDFDKTKRFPAQSPELRIISEANYRDPGGRDHLITLKATGSYEELKIDLSTSTGYNRTQTLALLFLGKTPDQVRQSLGDSALGTDPTRIDPTTNPSAGAADQLIKDVAGDWVSLLLGDSLEELTGLDVLRFQFDFGSIGLRGEKKLTENLRGIFDWERTVRGATVNVRGELRTPFRVTLQGGYLDKDFDSEAEEDIEEFQAKLVYRFFFP